MIEHVELARAYFAGADLDQSGEHVNVHNMAGLPVSPQPNGPAIMIGGGSPRVLRTAGQIADIVSINFDNSAGKIGAHGIGSGTADGTRQKIDWIREGAGDRFDDLELEIGAYFLGVTPDAASTPATLEAMAGGFGMPPEVLTAFAALTTVAPANAASLPSFTTARTKPTVPTSTSAITTPTELATSIDAVYEHLRIKRRAARGVRDAAR